VKRQEVVSGLSEPRLGFRLNNFATSIDARVMRRRPAEREAGGMVPKA
jgi:hypothetical protein